MDSQTQWRGGKGSVVSDVLPSDFVGGSDDRKYYGGYLICESVAPSMIPLIAAAPEMRSILESFVKDDPCAPGDVRMIAARSLLIRIAEGLY